MIDSFSHDSEASWGLISTTAEVLNPSVTKVIPQNTFNFIDFEVNLPILGREEGASGNSVESCHEIICCQIRVSQNVSRVPLSIFSTRYML